jgi:hypothetical protein
MTLLKRNTWLVSSSLGTRLWGHDFGDTTEFVLESNGDLGFEEAFLLFCGWHKAIVSKTTKVAK